MRKHLLSLIPVLLLSLFIYAQSAHYVEADVVGEGERCDQIAPPRSVGFQPDTCQPGLICQGSTTTNKVCVREIAPPAECTCLSPGNEDPGANGFQCPIGEQPTGYCSENDVCYERDGQRLGTNIPDQQRVFGGRVITGIECRPYENQVEADCTCLGTGRGGDGADANNFECKLATDDRITGTATCNDGQRCTTVPNTFNNIAKNQRGALFDLPGDVTMRGVTCTNPDLTPKPSPPPLPPVPPPPCAPGRLTDGVCKAFVTALGVIDTDVSSFVTNIFALLLAVAGGIALLLIMRAGYTLMTSSGNPEKVQTGRDQLVAAIVGLLFIIFSFVILEVIAVDVLRLPGGGGADGGGGTIGVPQGSVPYGGACTGSADCAGATPGGIRCNAGVCVDPGSP